MNIADIAAIVNGAGGGGAGGGGGGYDLVIRSDKFIADGITDDDLTLVKGSYAECAAKIQAGEPISAQVYSIETSDGVTTFNIYSVFAIIADIGYHNDIAICTSSTNPPAVTVKTIGDVNITIDGAIGEDDVIWLYVSESGVALE